LSEIVHDVGRGVAETTNQQPRLGETRDCLDPWYQPFIRTNGDVWPCCWLYESLGNVNETPFDQLINNMAFKDLRRELLTGQLRNACIECPSRGITTPAGLLVRLRSSVTQSEGYWVTRAPEQRG
jgi:radical SAM protein with 4Fe4S-binding SPASM domain